MDGSQAEIEITVVSQIEEIGQADWDACACPETSGPNGAKTRPTDPFTTYRFLHALEASGSVGEGTGWYPRYLIARREDKIFALAPLYIKTHSQGEYIFDHSWAQAFENAGGNYYPKLQMAIPFTPATGRRFLTKPGHEAAGIAALTQGAVQLAANNGFSSLHITFCTDEEAEAGQALGLLHRTSQQFHWHNHGYPDFEAFLTALSARKRKAIRKERRTANGAGLSLKNLTGDQITSAHWDAFWRFYQDTGARKWGSPYLTRAFFERVQETMRDDVLLMLAFDGETPIAGALNFIGRDALFGRYWGAIADIPCLHFELCYYRAIDYAIEHGLARVEAGAQGEHKLARGYLPAQTHSLHWTADQGFTRAIENYLEAERKAVDEETEILTSYGPFKKSAPQEQD